MRLSDTINTFLIVASLSGVIAAPCTSNLASSDYKVIGLEQYGNDGNQFECSHILRIVAIMRFAVFV